MDRQACPRNNIIANEIFPINKAFSTDCIITPIEAHIAGQDFSQCHLDKDYTKNSVYRNMYPVLFL